MADPVSLLPSLQELIQDSGLKPGDRVPSIRQLSERFGMSLATTRDGLVHAEQEGLIEIRPRVGAFVRAAKPQSQDSILSSDLRVVDGNQLHLVQTREILEVKIAGMVAARCRPADLLPIRESLECWLSNRKSNNFEAVVEADCRFHLGLAKITGNPVLVKLLELCLKQQYMQECWLIENQPEQDEMVTIHTGIYEAICDRDIKRARVFMRRHMKHIEELICRMIFQPPLKTGSTYEVQAEPG